MGNKKVFCREVRGMGKEIDIDDLTFRPSVYAVAIRDNKVLLVPQWDGYDFPGGGIECGETIGEALARELQEETNLSGEKGDILACESDFFIHPYSQKPYNSILIYYLCKNLSGEISTKNFDEREKEYAKKAEWVDRERIGDLIFYNPVDSVAIIEKAFKIHNG